MNRLHNRVMKHIEDTSRSVIEYGNLRRDEKWGEFTKKGDKIVFSYLVDVIAQRPMKYEIYYNLESQDYYCYSQLALKTDMANLLQFTSPDFEHLTKRLMVLAENIPNLRERRLREYIYSTAGQKPKRKWMRFFKKNDPDRDYLDTVIETMKDQKRISEHEARGLHKYVQELK